MARLQKILKNLVKLLKKSTKGLKEVNGYQSFKSLKAAGIGLVVALLNKAFEVLEEVKSSVMDAFNVANGTLTIAFNDLFKFITDNVSVITDAFDKYI